MNIITKKYLVIEWGNDIKDKEPFSFCINDKRIELSKHVSIMISKVVHDEYLRDSSIKTVNKYLNLSCNNTIDIISEFLKTGVLRFENDRSHNRDLFEFSSTFGIEYITNIFCEFVKTTYQEINEESFYDIFDCARVQNDTNKINECISFFASRMFDLEEGYKIKTIKRYGYDFFESVLKSESLKISNEDSLIDTIMSLSEYNNSFFSIVEHVRVEFCNNNSIKSIKNFSVKHGFESITTEVFERALINRSQIPHNLTLSNTNYIYKPEINPPKLKISNTNYFSRETILNKFEISNIEGHHKIDNSYENTRKLRNLRKTKDDFEQIYKILETASNEGDLSTIKFAVDEKYCDVCDQYGYNMILEAAWQNNLNLVKHLFNHGADIRSRTNDKWTVLHLFCCFGNLEGVKFALNYIDINDKNIDNETPFHAAIIYNHADICQFLISQPNIDKNAKSKDNETFLQYAIHHNKQNIVDILRKNGYT
ncbi:hypothetical protein TVAG_333180 [Trichomonas vaginalis G3]|uniref:Uncharacterized protein n=1 Tax=Trichomonas vaginalis (strain ATCC PRA-98 / G3) TaxID=412133 RepID=A2EHB4_TRIV3|nr:protein ubiquitination [Trichomonas vaginalis G3]EAY07993.1 hypothetical protein TVAG_333180 [Trichomonas vaginalis G3]KAI5486039.1 protein ubiquitination [Trichomonas vaginalis G3]|eukprot:XP_001320216.1 hypothetical protein [Trichomonas vaginalis G3]